MVKKTRNKSRVKDFLEKFDRYIKQREVVKLEILKLSDERVKAKIKELAFKKMYELPMVIAWSKLSLKEKKKCMELRNKGSVR